MQFQKKTSAANSNNILKTLTKIVLLGVFFFIIIVLVDKIDFPSPNQKIEKIISDENLKVIK